MEYALKTRDYRTKDGTVDEHVRSFGDMSQRRFSQRILKRQYDETFAVLNNRLAEIRVHKGQLSFDEAEDIRGLLELLLELKRTMHS